MSHATRTTQLLPPDTTPAKSRARSSCRRGDSSRAGVRADTETRVGVRWRAALADLALVCGPARSPMSQASSVHQVGRAWPASAEPINPRYGDSEKKYWRSWARCRTSRAAWNRACGASALHLGARQRASGIASTSCASRGGSLGWRQRSSFLWRSSATAAR
jgi:hypothetical protein